MPHHAHPSRQTRTTPTAGFTTKLRWLFLAPIFLVALSLTGCEVNTWMDPSNVAKPERTSIQLPILTRLAVIEPEDESTLVVSQVQPADLVPTQAEYTIGVGDFLEIQIFELLYPGQYSAFQERVNETGAIRLPIVGTIQSAGLTATQLETRIAEVLAEKQILFDALVSATVAGSQQNTYTVIGEPRQGTTRFGVYTIPRPDFRLLEAIALAGGIDGRSKHLLIIRQSPLNESVAGRTEIDQPGSGDEGSVDPLDLLNGAVDEAQPGSVSGSAAQAINDAVSATGGAEWVYVNGEWVRVGDGGLDTSAAEDADALGAYISQRVVTIPYQRLVDGDMRYNVVVRPGDTIRVPDPSAGFVYVGGTIARPGAYTVPGENELTVTQLVLSAGGFAPTATPARTEIRRRIGDDREAIVRIDLEAIFHGTAPNIYLKPNDEVIIGTNFWATPLAVVRNGFRFTYGFGFLADRNFGNDLFGAPPSNNR